MSPPVIDVLGAAATGHRRACPDLFVDGIDIRVLCATWGVRGLADGMYHHDPLTGRLDRLGPGPASPADLVPGADPGEVQAAAIVVGGLAEAVARHGDLGHRLLLLSAGAVIAALAHAASRRGVPCCEVGQVFPQPMRELAGVDGYRSAAVAAVVFGRTTLKLS